VTPDAAKQRLDLAMMDRALREARKGRPSPNPHVGAVVARGATIVSVGHHERCGEAHAEAMALALAGARARGATLYVTLEPCNHFGRTGPCTEAIMAAGIARVVVGCEDIAPHVPGSSARLRRAGIEVELGVRRKQAGAMVADFYKLRLHKQPYVVLKAAITLDGRLAARSGDSKWITGEAARREAHRMRAAADAVLVGVSTVLADDPELNVRLVRGQNPLRVVLDSRLRTPANSKLARVRGDSRTLIFHGPSAPAKRRAQLRQRGVELCQIPVDAAGRLRLRSVLRELGKREVMRLLVEGGARVHGALLDAGLVDEVALFVAPRILGDAAAIPLADGKPKTRLSAAIGLESLEVRRVGEDVLLQGRLKSPASKDATSALLRINSRRATRTR
jgi:diaminohydroxyphosphoribosylaminopyrimidine deaminase/5-amino-6-(5-phosphoribosylamino)uracil reductase